MDIERNRDTVDSELRLVAALRRSTREQGGPPPTIDTADALLDELLELAHSPQARRTPEQRGRP